MPWCANDSVVSPFCVELLGRMRDCYTMPAFIFLAIHENVKANEPFQKLCLLLQFLQFAPKKSFRLEDQASNRRALFTID